MLEEELDADLQREAPSKNKAKSTIFPEPRIKRIMLENEEIGRISAQSVTLLSKLCEVFGEELIQKCVQKAKSEDKSVIKQDDLNSILKENPEYAFLKDKLDEIDAS
ncbi:uncharacterized protein MONOS_17810 [Monocercomonoides exilis]|uniref:uncharacterized protein n=1 Tax=Monocercomonoides exilis TaxID=2049356 RepID=UPI003559832C|nr:hypothetical protein MONOS_17810 [Monocercomonoides exilis]